MQSILNKLRAAAEASRLRLLAILAGNELTVGELVKILGQSQPRVSRHLKLLCDAGLLERFQEGAWVFYRVADSGSGAAVAKSIIAMIPADDPDLRADMERLQMVKRKHAEKAMAYFRENAQGWDRIRKLYVGESAVEQAMLDVVKDDNINDLLDLGTGTGRILEVFSPYIKRGIGIDNNLEMIAIARANLEANNIKGCRVRQGNIYGLNIPAGAADVVTIHHVLHFLDDPAAVVKEAARILRPKGRLIIVDFVPHGIEFLRTEFAHRRLGFAEKEVKTWCKAAGLGRVSARFMETASPRKGEQLVVGIWTAVQRSASPSYHELRVA